jgi:formate C-acetyltransferase
LIVINASSAFIRRYGALAKKMASATQDIERKKELEEIGLVCSSISEDPAQTFHAALQLQWFAQVICEIETNGYSVSFGRVDQFFYPYYKKDMESGNLTPEAAQELLECYWLKPNEIIHVDDTESATYHGGHPLGLNLVVGGMTPDGKDATNELSYMFLQAQADVRMYQPNFGVRIHRGSRRVHKGHVRSSPWDPGMPQVFNDEVLIQAMMRYGPIEEARNYTPTGAWRMRQKTWIRGNGGWINVVKAVEYALNNGKCALTGKKAGLSTGDPVSFKTYDQFEKAVKDQLAYIIKQMVVEDNILDRLHPEVLPELQVSMLTHDCIEKGMSAAAGGARYNYTSPLTIGVATLGDSLAAAKKLVFDEKKISIKELQEALLSDFEGKEPLRQMLINRAPKYGNDDDYVDSLVAEMQRFFTEELRKYRSPRGGTFRPGFWTILANMTLGRFTGATPDGRKALEPLSDSIGPSNGCDRKDSTAVLCSAGKIDQTAAANGTVLNLRLSPVMFKGEGGHKRLEQLVRSYFDLGGTHLAINVVSTETLRDAQKHPERHRDLLVKVAGYAAFFVELGEKTQNEIIARTEYSLNG